MKPLGLRSKLTLLYTAIFSVLLGALFISAYYLLQSQLQAAATDELVERATALRGYLRFEDGQPVLRFDPEDPEVAYFVRTATRYYQVYDLAAGEQVEQSPELQFLGLGFGPAELQAIAAGPLLMDIQTDEGTLRFFNDRLVAPDGRVFLQQVGTSLQSLDLTLRRFRRLALWLLPLGLVLAATAGSLMARRVLRPIRIMATTAQEIEVSQLGRRLPLGGSGDELDTLAATFNEMLGRLDKAIGEMKQFTGSIAHELRTPLAALRGEAEVALLRSQAPEDYRRVLASQLEEFDRLTRMINQLLTLARAESGELRLSLAPFDAIPVFRNIVETLSLVAAEKDISLDMHTPGALTVEGDPQWLERAVVNLLDNAIKYTSAGGRIVLRAEPGPDGVAICVEDNGCGIPADSLPHIFERFYRADPARGKDIEGVGLGLSLVRWIVDQHDGSIEVSSRENEGTTFTLRLPSPSPDIKQV